MTGQGQYWYGWQHVHEIANRVERDGIEDRRQYDRIKEICDVVSSPKKAYLLDRFSHVMSVPSLEYLFGPEYVQARGYVIEDTAREEYTVTSCPYGGECLTDSTVCGCYDTSDCSGAGVSE